MVLSGGRVFEWAPGFAEAAGASVDWYEVLADDLGEQLADRIEVTARVDATENSRSPVRSDFHASSSTATSGCRVSRRRRRPHSRGPPFGAEHGARTRRGSSRSACTRHRRAAGAASSAGSTFIRCCRPPPHRGRDGRCGCGSMPAPGPTTSRSGSQVGNPPRSRAVADGTPSPSACSTPVTSCCRRRTGSGLLPHQL